MKRKVLSMKEKKIADRFISLEVPTYLDIKYPSPKIQSLFELKLHGIKKK